MSIKPLDKNTIRHLNSGQGIVNLESIVKELIENSIDANATSIELSFVENGLESIQIKDNGSGISESDRSFVGKRYYTSKLCEFNDLENVLTFGFRGEAINSICSISNKVTLTTKTKQDPIGKQYDLDQEGNLLNPKSSNLIPTSGTIIILLRPFHKLPVRRQLAHKNASQNMKKIHELITKYALSYPNIRFSYQVKNQQQTTWVKPVTKSIENSISIIFSAQLSNMLEKFIETDDSLTIDLIIPKSNSDPLIIYKEDRIFVYLNQRPINYVQSELKDVIALIKNRYRETIGLSDNNKKLPFIYLDIQLPPSEYDVNVEPSKTTILFHNKQRVYNLVEKVVDEVYPTKINKFFNIQPQKPSIIPKIISIGPEETEGDQEEEPLFMTSNKQQHKEQQQKEKDDDDVSPLFMNQLDEHQMQRLFNNQLDEDEEPIIPNRRIVNDDNGLSEEMSDNDGEHIIEVSSPQHPSVSPERMSTPIENMERSFTFSMGSEEEDDDDDIDEITRDFLQQNDLTSSEKNNALVKRTLIDHWQIDDTESVAPPTQVLPKQAVSVPVPESSTHTHTTLEKQFNPPPLNFISPVTANSPVKPTVSKPASSLVKTNKPNVNEKRSSEKLPPSSFWSSKPSFEKPSPLETSSVKRSLGIQDDDTDSTMTKKIKSVTISSPFQDASPKQLTRTLNQTQTIFCSLDKIKSNYGTRNNDKYRVRIEDCLFKCQGGPITNLMRVPKLNKYGVSLYTRGTQDAKVNEVGVVKLKMLQVNRIFKEMVEEHQLLCKSSLERPVQIQFTSEDVLCPVILSLKSKEVYIKDDLHGNKNITFSDITDERILYNGFKARWRKDAFTENIIVQLTGIYSLGTGYGPSDFRELLTDLQSRPKKVEQYLWTLAHEICKTQQEDSNERILSELDSLNWEQDQVSDWNIGYSNTHETIACKLEKFIKK